MSPESLEPPLSVETQLALLRQEVGQVKEILKGRGDDHESRLRKLEQRVWQASGAAAVIGAVVGAFAPTLFHG